MKLLQELLSLREEAIEVLDASDVWKENKDSSLTYITSKTYEVKEVGNTPKKYEVYFTKDGKRTLVDTFKKEDFSGAYTPVRSDQKADAEGFKIYRDESEVEAFKYEGDTIKVDLDGTKETLKKGDYLIRQTEGDNFVYSVESAKFFEGDYVEKK